MKLDVKVPRDADCKVLLRDILQDVKRAYGRSIAEGMVSDDMLALMIKASAWDMMGASFGSHVEAAVKALIDACLERGERWPST